MTNSNIIFLIIFVFIIRLLTSYLPSFGFDMSTWLGWADRLSSLGFSKFYSDTYWTQYTPGFLYYLWFIGKMGWVTEIAVKLPVIFADIGVGFLIWSLVKKINLKLSYVAFALYVLNPVAIFDGSIWGQIDGILTLFLFVSAYFLIEKRNFVLSVLFWSIAFLVKPQALAVAPIFILVILLRQFNFRKVIIGGVIGVLVLIVGSFPFFPSNPILGLLQWIIKIGSFYSYTSVFAFNIWSWVGFWKPDTTLFFGLSLASWGTFFLISSISLALYVFRNKLGTKANYYLLFAILSLCFFLFPTKVHERYLFPFFAFLLTAASLSKSKNLFGIYIITSIASFLNLYYPYSYYYPGQLRSDFLFKASESLAKLIGLIFLIAYSFLLFWKKLPEIRFPKITFKNSRPVSFPKVIIPKKFSRLILFAILLFALVTRTFDLFNPPREYFDEVYHAFTAKVIFHGGVQAWEWWNTPPEGYAYEWTHPPLAKLGMVLGMRIFGENTFGYRIPGALLGVGSVFLVYLLAKKLFKDEAMGLLSAAVFSLDGLPLVMSRIAMNDSYILFFALLSIYLFLSDMDLLSALSFGLAISSKWSAIWVLPILFVIWLRRKNKFSIPLILGFAVLPISIYLLSYLPMFLTGHGLDIWWGMQKQMWWYHTQLRATHPYTSPWWSWPFMIRPIYLYTSNEINGMVSRIYAIGNPVVFWFGVFSVILSFVYAYLEKNKTLGLVIFSYLIFFTPWALSPRIMFLYHYLPSIPFLAIAIAYILRRTPKIMFAYLIICLLSFIYFYPHWAGLSVPLWLDKSYYILSSWR